MNAIDITTDETDQIEELVAPDGWDLRCTQLEPGPLGCRYEIATLRDVNVHWESYRRGLAIEGEPPSEVVPFQMLVSASGPCTLHGRELQPGQLVVPGRDDGMDFTAHRAVQILTVHVPLEWLTGAGATLGCHRPRRRWTRVVDVGHETTGILRTTVRAAFATTQPARELESVLVSTLISALGDGERRRQRIRDPADRARRVRRARDCIHSHYRRSLPLHDLCAAAGVSERTLQRCFRETYGIGPVEYLRVTRLRAVRRALLAGDGATVTEVAMDHGFAHLGHFGRYYKSMFGETPSATSKRGLAERSRARSAPSSSAQLSIV